MPHLPRRPVIAALATATALALPAAAQALTAEEFVAVQNNLVARLGFTPMGRLEGAGGGLRLVDAGGRMVLPFDWGEIGWVFGPILLEEEGDAVLQRWEGELLLTLDYRPRPQGQKPAMNSPLFTTTFTVAGQDYRIRATGTPEEMTLTAEAGMIEARLASTDWWDDAMAPRGKPAQGQPQLALSLQDWAATLTLAGFTAGNTGTATLTSHDRAALLATRYAIPHGETHENGASAQEELDSTLTLTLPARPATLSGLTDALHAGLAFAAESRSAAGQTDSTRQSPHGNGSYRQSAGETTFRMGFDAAEGLTLAGESADLVFALREDWMAAEEVPTTIAQAAFSLALPFMAQGEREKASFSLDLTEMRSDTSPLFGRTLPEALTQAPFTLGLTVGADYEPLVDLTEFGGLLDILDSEGLLRAYDFGLDRLDLRYGEASLTGAGRLSWGLYGAVLGSGMPNPKGRATFTLTGAYALLDRLGQAGVLPPEYLSAARGAVAAFGQAKGPDVVESTIGLGPDGFEINGMPAPF